jgi:hypothetical protein
MLANPAPSCSDCAVSHKEIHFLYSVKKPNCISLCKIQAGLSSLTKAIPTLVFLKRRSLYLFVVVLLNLSALREYVLYIVFKKKAPFPRL